MNIIMLMPSSAIGAIVSGRFSMMAPSHGTRSASMHEAVWTHRDAHQHEAQYGTDAQPMKQRNDDGGSGQDDQGRLEQSGSKCAPRCQYPSANRKLWNACDTSPGVWIPAKCPELISRYSAPGICFAIGSITDGGRSLSCVQPITSVGQAMRGSSSVTVKSASMRLIAAKLCGSLASHRARNLLNSSAL